MTRAAKRILLGLLAALAATSVNAREACQGENLLATIAPSAVALNEMRAAAAAYPNHEGLFWRVERAGTPPSHLFGTYHATEPEVATPPLAVADAVRTARLLYVEVTPEEMAAMQAELTANPARILETTSAVLDDFLSPRQIDKAKGVFREYGLQWEAARRFKPWFLQAQLAQPPCSVAALAAGEELLDIRLFKLARQAGVEARGLEGWEVAIGLLEHQSVADQRRGLMQALDMAGQAENLRRTALDLYQAGEVMMIWEFGRAASRRLTGGADPNIDRMEREFWTRAVDERNHGFVATAREELARGGVVMAVGALHLPGREGVVELLRAEGYQVTRMD